MRANHPISDFKPATSPTAPPVWQLAPDWLKLPNGMTSLGDAHGDIAVRSNGDLYVSVAGGPLAGLQVYGSDGHYLRNVPGAPADLHGFILRPENGSEFIYGTLLASGKVIKMTLDGQVLLTISGESIPREFWAVDAKTNALLLKLTACAVAPNGDIYVTDGYGADCIHRFNAQGVYQNSFGGKAEPCNFRTLHKLTIDTRYAPARLLATDRANDRLVHFSLEGEWLGEVTTGLRLPSALHIQGDWVAIGELRGRVTILDGQNEIAAQLGTNEVADEIGTNQTPPAKWRPGIVNAAHGVTFNPAGDLFVTEWSVFGRVHRFNRLK